MKWTSVVAVLATLVASTARADTLDVDLNQLIDAAAASRNRFAVDIPHPVSGTNAWNYSVRIPGAISMSFHASGISLPGNAVLTVTAGNTTTTYHGRDISDGGLWGRPLLGDTLSFTLSGEGASVQIQSFQAGYRALGGVVPDHPHYTARIKALALPTARRTIPVMLRMRIKVPREQPLLCWWATSTNARVRSSTIPAMMRLLTF